MINSGRAVVVHDGKHETLVDELEVRSMAREGLWLHVLPSVPTAITTGDPKLLDDIASLTAVHEPYNELLRRTLFGPSVVTLLTKRLIPEPKSQDDEAPADLRRLELRTPVVFSGAVITSTITKRPVLPGGLVDLVERTAGEKIAVSLQLELAAYLNRGWAIAAIPFSDTRPSETAPAHLGPIHAKVISPQPVYPFGLIRLPVDSRFELFVIAEQPLVPLALEATWDRRPWESDPEGRGRLHITYNRPVADDVALDILLRDRNGLGIPPGLRLLRAELLLPRGVRPDLDLVPAKESVTLPTSTGRGSGADLFACVLLGLTPLLYTPESWFLLWLGARAKARARRGRRSMALGLWSLYAIAVGVFWFFTMEGGARVAAIIPALVGLAQLALPYVDREPTPVRVQFKKKKPSGKTS